MKKRRQISFKRIDAAIERDRLRKPVPTPEAEAYQKRNENAYRRELRLEAKKSR